MGDSIVELRAESAFFSEPNCQVVYLEPGEIRELDALRFVPKIAGAEQIRFSVTVKTPAKTPRGRLLGAVVTSVEGEEKKVEAGRDVIIVGGAIPGAELPEFDDVLGVGNSGWQSLDLHLDGNFNRRLLQACPDAIRVMSPALDSSNRLRSLNRLLNGQTVSLNHSPLVGGKGLSTNSCKIRGRPAYRWKKPPEPSVADRRLAI